jgi:hypothetical protein
MARLWRCRLGPALFEPLCRHNQVCATHYSSPEILVTCLPTGSSLPLQEGAPNSFRADRKPLRPKYRAPGFRDSPGELSPPRLSVAGEMTGEGNYHLRRARLKAASYPFTFDLRKRCTVPFHYQWAQRVGATS